MSVRTLGSGLFSCLLVAGLFGACVAEPDGGDGTSSVSADLDVPPQAAFTVVCIDKTCFADAETSSDDVFIANYHWDWATAPSPAAAAARRRRAIPMRRIPQSTSSSR